MIQPMPNPATPLDRFALLIASGFGSGYAPFAPGTAGSLVGLVLWLPLATAPWAVAVGATLFVAGLGIWAGDRTARRLGAKDPGLVVVDEIAGMWVTLLFLPFTPVSAALAFVAFRAMDVFKPWPARRFERFPGGWGIMADDLMAGVYANLLVRLGGLVYPLA